jgi:hypothetical protein
VLLADAQFLVAERIRGKGYRQEESGPCWEAPPPPDPHAVVTCTLDFGRTGGGYGVTFVVSPRYASVITSSASYKLHNLQEMPVTVDAAPVISMTSSVG